MVSFGAGFAFNAFSAEQNRKHKIWRMQKCNDDYERQFALGEVLYGSEPSAEKTAYYSQLALNQAKEQESIRRLPETGDLTDLFHGLMGVVSQNIAADLVMEREETTCHVASENTEVALSKQETIRHTASEAGSTIREFTPSGILPNLANAWRNRRNRYQSDQSNSSES